MAEAKTINDLPDELLVEIFSYLTFKDLILSAQLVCRRWADVSRDVELWKDITYSPDPRSEHREILNILEKAPMLRSFASGTDLNIQETVDALCEHCKDIRKLDFYNSAMLTPAMLKKLFIYFPKIESLGLGLNLGNGMKCMELVGQYHSLKKLAVYGCELRNTAGILSPIANGCYGLEYLNLARFYHVDNDLAYVLEKKKHQLKGLLLNYNYLSEMICSIGQCTQLEILALYPRRKRFKHFMSGRELCFIGCLPRLKALCLPGLGTTSPDTIVNFFQHATFSLLEELELSYYGYLNKSVAESIQNCCPGLKRLILLACFDRSVEGLEDMLKFSNLELLVLCPCDNFPEGCIAQLAKLHKLKHLTLRGCESLTDDHVGRIISCLKLEYLNLASCVSLTDKVLTYILKCSSLRTLVLDNCLLTGQHLPFLVAHMKHLKCLSVENCWNMNSETLSFLRESMPPSDLLYSWTKKSLFYVV